jgi:FtsP/CotA-like multicopper oxidase with cupredoxin domain
MTVNGKIWPKLDVKPRHYRLRLLNGCDSRFLIIRFCRADDSNRTEFPRGSAGPNCTAIPFYVIGSDQGLRFSDLPQQPDFTQLVVEPGSRYDIIINFAEHFGKRVIMANLGPDTPFDGTVPDSLSAKSGTYLFTDRIMAFDVAVKGKGASFDVTGFNHGLSTYNSPGGALYPRRVPDPDASTPTRSVGLFEGEDEYGRLQPLLGTVYPTEVLWPDTHPDSLAGKPMQGTMTWHEPTTELPILGTTEYWDIWNLSPDAHPIHLHLVHFEVVGRYAIVWADDESGIICVPRDGSWTKDSNDPNDYPLCPDDDGTSLLPQPLVQHSGEVSHWGGRRVVNPTMDSTYMIPTPDSFFEDAPKDMVIALPDQVTRIKATFDKPGNYSWHCHLLSHEDHEMMRVLEVVDPPTS